jgi:hypothetical protein
MIRARNGGRGLTLAAVGCVLSACAGAPPPAPITFEIADWNAYRADLAMCKVYAQQARQSLSLSSVGTAGAKAGLATAPTAAVNPLAPVIGAVAGASGEALNELNVLGQKEHSLVVDCMKRKGDKSGAYFVLDPASVP